MKNHKKITRQQLTHHHNQQHRRLRRRRRRPPNTTTVVVVVLVHHHHRHLPLPRSDFFSLPSSCCHCRITSRCRDRITSCCPYWINSRCPGRITSCCPAIPIVVPGQDNDWHVTFLQQMYCIVVDTGMNIIQGMMSQKPKQEKGIHAGAREAIARPIRSRTRLT